MKYPLVTLNDEQRKQCTALLNLLSNYNGNAVFSDYKFVKALLDTGKDYRSFFKPSLEVLQLVDGILGKELTESKS